MCGHRVVNAGRGFKSAGRLLFLALVRQPSSSVSCTRVPFQGSRCEGGGADGRRWSGGGGGGSVRARSTLACNVACVVFFLRGHVDGRRPRRCAARLGAGGVAAQRVEEGEDGEALDRDVALAPDAVLNLGPGDPTMYEAFWREVGDRGATVIRGWQVMSYDSDAAALCWFLEPELEREVRRLHRVVGNAVVDGYHLVVGTGATQLYQGAMYALSSPARGDQPVPVVSPAPYYSSYPPQTDLLRSGFYRWAGDANTFTGDECIELVCSPNNPDGAIREAVVRSAGAKAIHDLVYYWPQYTPITGRVAHDIMVFTLSKVTGHAGTRLGWALVKDREVARKMVYFVDRSTIGVSKESQMRATKILRVVSDAYEVVPSAGDGSTVPRLFDFARRRMEERWRTLRATVAASGVFSLPEETSGYCNFAKQTVTACPAFAWLRCEKEGVEDCAKLLAGHKIMARGGEQFGGDTRCVRINILDRDNVFNMLVQRLSAIN